MAFQLRSPVDASLEVADGQARQALLPTSDSQEQPPACECISEHTEVEDGPVDAGPAHAFTALDYARLETAVSRLDRISPLLSARTQWTYAQRSAGFICLLLLAVALFYAAPVFQIVVFVGLTVPFLSMSFLRCAALYLQTSKRSETHVIRCTHQNDIELPTYAILVPMYDEAASIPGLIESLARLDYPTDKLDIVLILEQDDVATRAAIDQVACPGHIRCVIVPRGEPRTKPRALNYAIQGARGAFVVVYDAEDAPEPDQLRKAVLAFANGDNDLACLQARLNIDNREESWFSRQFTIEYSVLFGALLPVLERLRLPIPLGGTSNHFRRDALEAVGGWDAFNVTEDADLGLRLARAGYRVRVLNSTTWEEAPSTWRSWLGQRRRWLKGWMQTFLVHTRRPSDLAYDLGPWGLFGFFLLMASLILSALVHPWVIVLGASSLAGVDVFGGTAVVSNGVLAAAEFVAGQWTWPGALWTIALCNLILGYATSIGLAMLVISRLGWRDLVGHCLMMPMYWLLISWAGYAALYELFDRPHHWEKTAHRHRIRT